MTTFQVLIDAFVKALTQIVPISKMVPETLTQSFLHWSLPNAEMELLVLSMGSIAFISYFRFDWLGMISAAITSIVNPLSLKSERRTLDQHTLLFLLLVLIPSSIINHFLRPLISESEFLNHPFFLAGITIGFGLLFQFSYRWNKRIFGLNHLRLSHGMIISLITLGSMHPALPLIGLLWIGFALNNYHFEAIFKYSMLILGVKVIAETISLLGQVGLKNAFEQVGYLNGVAVFVIGFSVFWIGLENLQKTLSEMTYKTFQWINLFIGAYYIALYFLRA